MYFWIIANSVTGAIGASSGTHEPDSTLAPNGFTFIGPYDDASNPMPTEFKTAYDNPLAYIYQNGSFVPNPNYATQSLAQAKQAQIAQIEAGFNATLNSTFGSKTTGHTYNTDPQTQSDMMGELQRFQLDSTITSINFKTVDAGYTPHTPAQLQGAFLDGGKWKQAQFTQLQSLIGQVNAATNVSAVGAIVWTPASY